MLCLLYSLCLIFDGELVLHNKKLIAYSGQYEVKGNAIHFTTRQGKPMQLPLKMVDLEKTKARAAAQEAEREAARNRKKTQRKKRKRSILELAGDDTMREGGLVMDDRGVSAVPTNHGRIRRGSQSSDSETYSDEYASGEDDEPLDVEEAARKKQFVDRYRKLSRELEGVVENIDVMEERVEAAEENKPHTRNNDVKDTLVKMKLHKMKSELRELKKREQQLRRQIKDVRRKAKSAGFTLSRY